MKVNIIISNQHPTILYAVQELKHYMSLLRPDFFREYTFTLVVKEDLSCYEMPPAKIPYLDDQYYIHTNKDGGIIAASNPRSILLGVYEYLRKIGFRFLQPGENFTYVPDITTLESLYTEARCAPSFRQRGICLEGASSLENILDFIDWMPKAGFNCFFVQFQLPYAFLERWYHHTNNPAAAKEEFTLSTAEQMNTQINEALSLRSLLHHRVGHGWTCEAAGYPSFGWMETPEKQDTTLLAELDGKRSLFHGVPLNTNLCYSNPEVIRIMSDKVLKYALEHPEVDYLHIWLADEHNNVCECPACQQSLLSDQYIHLLNVIDEKLTEQKLPTRIVFLLYHELLWAPETKTLAHPDRFTLMFAPISRVFMESFPDKLPDMPVPSYQRNQIELPSSLEENLSFLNSWLNYFKGDSFIFDYPLGRAHYGDLSYIKISSTISQDIKHLDVLHLNGYISCQELRAAFPNGLPNYVMGHTLLDQSISFEDLKEDFFFHAYGREYKAVMAYLEKLSALYQCDYYNGKGKRVNPDLCKNFQAAISVILDFQPVIKNHISQSVMEKSFWDILDYHSEYSLRLTKALLWLSQGEHHLANDVFGEFKAYICQQEENYQPFLDVYRVIEVSEKYTGFGNNS